MLRRLIFGLSLAGCAGPAPHAVSPASPASPASPRHADTTAAYWPTDGWREATPESEGFSSAALADMIRRISASRSNIHGLLVIRHGNVILDASFYPFAAGSRHDIASNTKSVTSLVVGAAVMEGRLTGADQRIFEIIRNRPARPDARKERITVGNLLAMRSGFDCGSQGEVELDAMRSTANWIQAAMDLPMSSDPDTRMGYCSPGYHLISKALQDVTGMPLADYAARTLFRPLGITDYFWSADPHGVTHGWGDLQLRPRDLARIGFLAMHDGVWESRRLLPPGWIAATTRPRSKYGDRNSYGMGWWTHSDSPPSFYEGIGRGGQRLSVWPEKGVIVVFTGGGFDPGPFGQMLMSAYRSDSALASDADGVASLRTAVVQAAATPAPTTIATIPDAARAASGLTYDFPANPFGLRTLRWSVTDTVVRVEMQLTDRRLDLPVGLDGLYRISADTVSGIRPGGRGTFRGDTFTMELDLIGKINRYAIEMHFVGNELKLGITELTGRFRMNAIGMHRR